MKERMPESNLWTDFLPAAEKTEHFTSPPKPYSEDTLRQWKQLEIKESDEDTEKKGLGNSGNKSWYHRETDLSPVCPSKRKTDPPTLMEKSLLRSRQILKSASMTAEWENQLL